MEVVMYRLTTMMGIAPLILAAALPAPAARADEAVPPWNIGGSDWVCVEGCAPGKTGAPARLVQDGGRFVFVSETGAPWQAEWRGGIDIAFINCDNNVQVLADARRLEFTFGAVWTR
jgi:hypothetical protein